MSHRETSPTDSRSQGVGRTLEKQSMLDKLQHRQHWGTHLRCLQLYLHAL
jgi:hypothetical protein